MTLYDNFGREVVAYSLDFSLSDLRYIRKDTSDSFTGDLTCSFVNSNIRIKNGKLQIQNEDSLLWHNLRCKNIDGNATYFPDDNPTA